jgi:hypothetical protein
MARGRRALTRRFFRVGRPTADRASATTPASAGPRETDARNERPNDPADDGSLSAVSMGIHMDPWGYLVHERCPWVSLRFHGDSRP